MFPVANFSSGPPAAASPLNLSINSLRAPLNRSTLLVFCRLGKATSFVFPVSLEYFKKHSL
ncbi:hypothetical protein HanRHA438_Chr16g0774011 [Helianthus annuus]|nr:hypothetical protein HanRHA438_Chr16g0774011 [Helianthus annuus]